MEESILTSFLKALLILAYNGYYQSYIAAIIPALSAE
jgi:hypothetical protein